MMNNEYRIQFTYGLPADAKKIREEVFMKEQGFEDEFDEYDNVSYHAVLYYQNQAVATARTFVKEDRYIIGRVAVIEPMRKHRLGRKVMLAVEDKIKELGGTQIELSAQSRVQKFYQSIGYQTVGEAYFDEGCPHIKMVKIIEADN